MKVNLSEITSQCQKAVKTIAEKVETAKPVTSVEASASECFGSWGKAQVAMQNKVIAKPHSEEQVKEIVNKIAEEQGLHVGRYVSENRISLGRPIDGFKNLYRDDMRVKCIRNSDGFLDEIYVLDNASREVFVYNPEGSVIKHFSSDDMRALKEYKYSPEAFHSLFRRGKKIGIQTEEELQRWSSTINKLFANESKVWTTDKPTKVYRALQDYLTPEQTEALSHVGGLFKDASYVSTTTNLDTARRFKGSNPILEIELPEKTKYLDLDTLFNIDRKHWSEQEFLLPKNSKFAVTAMDEQNNIIKVKLLT